MKLAVKAIDELVDLLLYHLTHIKGALTKF